MRPEDDSQKPDLQSLNQRLEALRSTLPAPAPSARERSNGNPAIDFASASLVGGGLGFFLDREFGTLPWCLIAGLVLGVAAGTKRLLNEERQRDLRASAADRDADADDQTNHTTAKH